MRRIIKSITSPKTVDIYIKVATWFLLIFGSFMVVSASMGLAIGNNTYLLGVTLKLGGFGILGIIAMGWLSRHFSFELVDKAREILMGIVIVSLVACLANPGAGGAKAWIPIPLGFMEATIQPSEFAKVACVIIIALYLGDNRKRYNKAMDLIKYPIGFVVLCAVIILFFQSDLGSAAVLLFMSFVCFLIPQNKILKPMQKICVGLFVVAVCFAVFILAFPQGEKFINSLPFQQYQLNRMLSAINPFVDQYDTGYQLISGLKAFSIGGLQGSGFGSSIMKYTRFPAANTDYIASVVVEELGFLGFSLIAIAYFVIIFVLFKYAFKMRSEKGKIILVGVAMYIFIHYFFNVGGVTGLIPLTGVPLLMISAGGSSTLSLMMAIGIAQAVISQYKEGKIK